MKDVNVSAAESSRRRSSAKIGKAMHNPFNFVLTELNERELRALVAECLCTIKLSPAFSHLPEQSLLQLHAVAAGIGMGGGEHDALVYVRSS
jgi:hypothetical protein